MRTIGVVTVARSDYGIYRSILRQIAADPELRLQIIASGMHLAPEFGNTVSMIEADGYSVSDRVESLLASDSPEGISKSMGLGVMGFSQVFARSRPDLLLVLGDRFDMYPAVVAALPFRIPVAHLHGGEVSFGAIDDALRHSMTKLSHLHFVSTEEYRQRVLQMGEEPWRVTVSGAPALDELDPATFLGRAELEQRFGLRLDEPPLLITFHPASLQPDQVEWQTAELLAAVEVSGQPAIFTAPNADTGGRRAREMMEGFASQHPRMWFVENFGQLGYFSAMNCAAAMVGNSSSGIIEAASFHLPVVNIGERQEGRSRAANVIDVGYGREEILAGLRRALGPGFRSSLKNVRNPYRSTGSSAAVQIVERLKAVPLDEQLTKKRFCDWPRESGEKILPGKPL
jgi:UDP-hydrolysing UDP-N-acetyl-D-glucosamine 2-epimerase